MVVRALPVGPDGTPATRIVGSIHDVEARRQLEEQLRRGALYDEVTGLPNRRLFLERLAAAIAREREDGRRYAVAFFDLDGFKLVNDSLGHLAGDRLLATVGERLRGRLRRSDVAARFGGDEFAILLHDIPASAVTTTVADVLADIRQPVDLDGYAIVVSASTGITTSNIVYSTPDEVIRDADLAMYRAKATETGSAVVFDELLRAGGLNAGDDAGKPPLRPHRHPAEFDDDGDLVTEVVCVCTESAGEEPDCVGVNDFYGVVGRPPVAHRPVGEVSRRRSRPGSSARKDHRRRPVVHVNRQPVGIRRGGHDHRPGVGSIDEWASRRRVRALIPVPSTW